MQGGLTVKRRISLFLSLALILACFPGCGRVIDNSGYEPTGDALLMDGQDPEDLIQDKEPQELTLAYCPSRSMNPLIGYNQNNRLLMSLIYQGLFATDNNGMSHPILCSAYYVTPDNRTWSFQIEPLATFSDGTRVTLEDVKASYDYARTESSYYKGRFTYVHDIQIEDNAIVFYLTTPYENLALLLDIPIVKAEDVSAEHPRGTGPYTFEEGLSGTYMAKNRNWWGRMEIAATADSIRLMEAETDAEIRDLFEFGDVGVVCTNPLSDSYADFRCDYELWDCDSGMFLYLACNVQYSKYFEDGYLRTVLTYAIDRQHIVDTYYHGHAQIATLAVSPSSKQYSKSLAAKYGYDSLKFISAIGGWQVPKFPDEPNRVLRILVNCDDSARLRAARDIAETLTEFGIPAGTLEYGGSTNPTYEVVLRAENWDMYLGQTRLPPTGDLSEFFRGWGNLKWGGLPHEDILTLCKESLANSGNYYNLVQLLADDGRIIPLLFGDFAVYAKRGLLPGLSPSRDNVFFYTMGKTMEGIRIETKYN